MKKVVSPAEKREAAQHLIEEEQCSVSKACLVVQLPRSSYQYKAKLKDDSVMEDALTAIVEKHPTIGFWHRIIGLKTVERNGIISLFTEFIAR